MTNFADSDLRDASPPIPGEHERALVAARARQLGRRRRMMQGVGALGMVAALAVGVAALTAGGSSPGAASTTRIDAAGPSGATASTVAPTADTAPAAVPAPVTAAPVPASAPQPAAAPSADAAAADPATGTGSSALEAPAPAVTPPSEPRAVPAAPTTFTVSGTVSNIPDGAIVTLTLSGPGGTFTAAVDSAGRYSMSGVPAGTYDGRYQWETGDGTAAQIGRLDGITISGDSEISFALP